MNTKMHRIAVNGVSVEIVRKAIKNLHLGVYPPHGRVRVAAPMVLTDDAIRLAVIGKLGWIRRHQNNFIEQPRESTREYVSGESHYYLGRRYRLDIVRAKSQSPRIELKNKSRMRLFVCASTSREEREKVLLSWHRRQLRRLAPPIIMKWEDRLGAQVAGFGIKRMKTKWGSCGLKTRRIWLNLELAKKPLHCIEYIVAHEIAHLIERHHSNRFASLMNRVLPKWRHYRDELNASALAEYPLAGRNEG